MAKKSTKKSSPTPKKLSSKKKVAPAKSSAKIAKKPVVRKPVVARKVAAVKPAKPVVSAKITKSAKPVKIAKPVSKKAIIAKPVLIEQKPVVKLVGKPGRNQAGLSNKDLGLYRELLLAKRRELLGDVFSMEEEALHNSGGSNLSNLPIHMADMGTDNYEQEFTLGLVEKDRKVLREIHVAIAKIVDGTYGICEGTGKPISKARLEAQPWTRYSIEHARKLEQRRP